MIGSLVIGDFTGKEHIRFRTIKDYEAYNNSIDQGYDLDDSIFNGYIFILNTPDFTRVNRSHYGKG